LRILLIIIRLPEGVDIRVFHPACVILLYSLGLGKKILTFVLIWVNTGLKHPFKRPEVLPILVRAGKDEDDFSELLKTLRYAGLEIEAKLRLWD